MATITYAYGVDAVVYHVGDDTGVRKAVVKKVKANVTQGNTVAVEYDVAFMDARDGVITAPEATLFADVDLALAHYKTLVA